MPRWRKRFLEISQRVVLEELHISNLALVASLDIEFGSGFNAVTGETGAGKSLILGALQLLLGERAGPGVIRTDTDRCEIVALIRLTSHYEDLREEIDGLLEEAGIAPGAEGELLLRRVVTPSGSRSYVNSTSVTLTFLRGLGDLLVDIHGPHEHQSLLKPRNQLAVLDAYAGTASLADRCRGVYSEHRQLLQELEEVRSSVVADEQHALLRHQVREIESAGLVPGEEDELKDKFRVASSSRRLIEIAVQCRRGLEESDGSITERLAPIVRLFQEMESYDSAKGGDFLGQLESVVSSIQELSSDLESYAQSVELDEAALVDIEERLDLIQKCKRKYGPSVEAVLESMDRMKADLAEAEGVRERVEGLAKECRDLEEEHLSLCGELSRKRRKSCVALAEEVSEKLKAVDFTHAQLEIELDTADPGPSGSDRIEFRFAPNPGERARPLRDIASSGEVARVMLALKSVLTVADRVPILIFDEVDANIGGRVAGKVAVELAAIARRHQVFVITHLPQIAVAGDRQFRVTKTTRDSHAQTEMKLVKGGERERELTRMLGAEEGSDTARRHVREMMKDSAGASPG